MGDENLSVKRKYKFFYKNKEGFDEKRCCWNCGENGYFVRDCEYVLLKR